MNYGSLQSSSQLNSKLSKKERSALHFSDSQQKDHKKFLGKKL